MNVSGRSRSGAKITVLLLVLGACLIFAQQGRFAGILLKPENISFVGNRAVASEDLKAIFRSAGTVTAQVPAESIDIYNGDRIAHSLNMIQTIYRNLGFIKAAIAQPDIDFGAAGDAKIQVVMNVTENRSYRLGQVRINGARALPLALLTSMLNLQPKRPINPAKIKSGALAIREAYYTLGYLDADIRPVLDAPDQQNVADLIVKVTEGPQYHVGRLELVGRSPIKESLLRQFLPLEGGDIFGQKSFESCLQSLNELGITPVLTASDVTFTYNREKALVDLAIHLEGNSKR